MVGTVSCCCEHGNEPSGSMKCCEFLEQLSDRRLLKEDSAPWVSLLAENAWRECRVGAEHNCFSRRDWIHLAYNQSSHRVLWNYFCYSRSQACVLNHTSLHSGRCVHGNITWQRGHILFIYELVEGRARGSVVVKALCYKPEGRGFDSRWGDFF
jgi:hypothetical protein